MKQILIDATLYYNNILKSGYGNKALSYLKNDRGLFKSTIEQYTLGTSNTKYGLYNHLIKLGHKHEDIVSTKLVKIEESEFKFRDHFYDGRTTFTNEEEIWLFERSKKFKRIYDNLTIFELGKINGCVVQSREFINEICDKLLYEEGYGIIFVRNPSSGRVSIRHNIDGLNIGQILKDNNLGGGHAQAAGAFVDGGDSAFKKMVNFLEDIIKVNFPKERT